MGDAKSQTQKRATAPGRRPGMFGRARQEVPPRSSASSPTFNSTNHSGINNNVNGDFHAGGISLPVDRANNSGERLGGQEQNERRQQTSQSPQPQGQHQAQLSLESVATLLTTFTHTALPILDPETWLEEEQEYVVDVVLKHMLDGSSDATLQKWIRKVQRSPPQLYPRLFIFQSARIMFSGAMDRASNLKQLHDSHILYCVSVGNSAYTKFDTAAQIGEKLYKWAPTGGENSATDELDIEGTIGNLWAADLVGIYAQKKWLGMQE
ncbi:hypothetical protein FIBSPDRAFT_926718 [Athelia psychrophila]|uniref:Uncharacterized protein n=1 Tax=Athelia psychrophila TaxID=1759441 RepID=A0A166SUG9_9AGAM|nr:hypothetical protein FIBSPDRAFT_940318 [Fibularhizoctonia sp. CBS 109695]KZP29855.1 hypothetical protein FIBSPDRAFT_926718 [Fibularhizoctonia sp. CBS 109695]